MIDQERKTRGWTTTKEQPRDELVDRIRVLLMTLEGSASLQVDTTFVNDIVDYFVKMAASYEELHAADGGAGLIIAPMEDFIDQYGYYPESQPPSDNEIVRQEQVEAMIRIAYRLALQHYNKLIGVTND